MIQAYFKGKLVIQDNCIKKNEDFKTSSSIGLLQYLPDDIFWRILRNSCVGFNTKDFGKIESFNFWAHTDATDTTNNQLVEPDVWIETEKYDVIIEAKIGDIVGQTKGQWAKEIQSIINEQNNNDSSKPIILIALGGNENMQNDEVMDCPIYKASWYNLLNAIVNERNNQDENGNVCRVLDDVIEMFARQGVMKIDWFNTLPIIRIQENALELWGKCTNKSSIGFAMLTQMNINETIIQKWKPIN
ncbi:MAG: hypothetical protein MJZ70_01125 [Bacteroidales bacterium]|nr:hypothetical protein [Bacteroidales bacterium]